MQRLPRSPITRCLAALTLALALTTLTPRSPAAPTAPTPPTTRPPNPAFNPDRFNELYVDFDPSRFRPLEATPADWARVATWRRAMDAAVARP